VIGKDFYYDEGMKTCQEHDLFIRLGLRFGRLGIIEKDETLNNAMFDRSSKTYRPEIYDQIAQDKSYIFNRFFGSTSSLSDYLRKRCISSIYCELASKLLAMGEETLQLYHYLSEAARYTPGSERLADLLAQTRGATLNPNTGQVLLRTRIQPALPPPT